MSALLVAIWHPTDCGPNAVGPGVHWAVDTRGYSQGAIWASPGVLDPRVIPCRDLDHAMRVLREKLGMQAL